VVGAIWTQSGERQFAVIEDGGSDIHWITEDAVLVGEWALEGCDLFPPFNLSVAACKASYCWSTVELPTSKVFKSWRLQLRRALLSGHGVSILRAIAGMQQALHTRYRPEVAISAALQQTLQFLLRDIRLKKRTSGGRRVWRLGSFINAVRVVKDVVIPRLGLRDGGAILRLLKSCQIVVQARSP
jgi:hypothetical protein